MHKVIFTGTGGYEGERKRANSVMEVGKEYTVIGGTIHSWCTEFVLEEVPGSWNSTHFDVDYDTFSKWDCMVHSYPR